ncbi:Uncharacterized protein OBRU01_15568, partial [Operophtera brumata]
FASDSIKTLSRETILDLRMVSLVPVSNPDDSVEMADETLKSDVVKTELTLKLEYCSVDEHVIDDGTSPDQHPTVVVKKEKLCRQRKETINYPHACDVCSKTFLLKTLLKSHIMTAHALEMRYPCKTCHKKFTNSLKLNKHIKKKHPEEHPLACNACDRILTKISNWRRHIDTHIGVRPFTCDCCLKTFPEKGTLKRHMKIHNSVTLGNNDKPIETGFHFVCVTCGQGFELLSSKRHLQGHVLRVHTDKSDNITSTNPRPEYSCKLCGKSYLQKKSLTIHIRLHTGEKPYSCTLCRQLFARQSSLRRHVRIHSGETFKRSNPCEVCGKTFSQPCSLLKHRAVHSEQRPFGCDTCGKAFSRKDTLTYHIKLHTGIKPYNCKMCGMSFACTRSLSKHMKTHSEVKPYVCVVCYKLFAQR